MEEKTKALFGLFALGSLSLTAHHLIEIVFRISEPILIFSGFGLLVCFVVYFIYVLIRFFSTREPRDLWKLGFLGALGLLGLAPPLGHGFFGLYVFFALFGLRRKGD